MRKRLHILFGKGIIIGLLSAILISSLAFGVADLSIVVTDAPDPVIAGTALTYTIVFANSGPDPTMSTVVSDILPTYVTNPMVSFNGTDWSSWGGSYAVPAGFLGITTMYIRGTVDASAVGTINNAATINDPDTDPNPGNNTSSASSTVVSQCDLGITIAPWPDTQPVAGGQFGYIVYLENAGPSTGHGLAVTGTTPLLNAEYAWLGTSVWAPWTGSVLVGDMGIGARGLMVRGTLPTTTGPTLSTVTLTTDSTDPVPANNVATSNVTVLAAPAAPTATPTLPYTGK